MLTQSPRGLIPLLDANTQGIYELNPTLVEAPRQQGAAKAYYVTSGNAHVPPEAEFVVLQDIFESGLLERADVVLPGTGLPEDEGTIVSMESRVQAISPIARAPGTSMADWMIVAKISSLLGGSGFNYDAAEQVTQEMFASSAIPGLGLMVKPMPISRLYPINGTSSSKQMPSSGRPVHAYRGADIVDKVDDLYRLYRYRGVVK
jgi:NADH dehydrogenase/NADH:ubiquinone oxidoreductase subunit G